MSDVELPEAVFHREGPLYVPSGLARGPWHADSQHGSAMAGVLAHAIEHAPSEPERPMQVVRLTMELLRAAPFAPVSVALEVRHSGKNTELIDARLEANGELCALARAVRYRRNDLPVGADWEPSRERPKLDPSVRMRLPRAKTLAFHDMLHLSPVDDFAQPILWLRMLRPLIAGEAPTPLVRLAVALDWGYAAIQLRGMSRDLQARQKRPFVAINTDNHVALTRELEGEWVCLDATTLYGNTGAGATGLRISDERGLVAFGTQSMLLRGPDKRPKAW